MTSRGVVLACSLGFAVLVLGLSGFFLFRFLAGWPMTGRAGGAEIREFVAHGPGAFAADHVNWLTPLGFLLGIGIATLMVVVPYRRTLACIAFVVAAGGSLASIVLLAGYQSSGVPFQNYRTGNQLSDDLAYGTAFVLPGIFLGLAIFLGVVAWVVFASLGKKRRDAAKRVTS